MHALSHHDARYATADGNSFPEGDALMRSSAERYHDASATDPDDRNWPGWCESAAVRFVGSPGGFDTATEALNASIVLSTDVAAAIHGTVHWWRDRSAPNTGAGHVAIGYASSRLCMASSAVDDAVTAKAPGTDRFHAGLGIITAAFYAKDKPGVEYVGWGIDLAGTVLRDTILVVQVPGQKPLWRMDHDRTRHHLSPSEWSVLKRRGVHIVPITAERLALYRAA